MEKRKRGEKKEFWKGGRLAKKEKRISLPVKGNPGGFKCLDSLAGKESIPMRKGGGSKKYLEGFMLLPRGRGKRLLLS